MTIHKQTQAGLLLVAASLSLLLLGLSGCKKQSQQHNQSESNAPAVVAREDVPVDEGQPPDEPGAPPDIKTLNDARFSSAVLGDGGLSLHVKEAPYQLPACNEKQHPCPSISIDHVLSNLPWLNTLLDQQVLDAHAYDIDGVKHTPQSFQQIVDELWLDTSEDDPQSYDFSDNTTLGIIGQHGNSLLLLLQRDTNAAGAAHGEATLNYVVVDLKQKKRLLLKDILLPGQKEKLRALLYPQFVHWVTQALPEENMIEYEKDNPLHLSNNFVFGKKALAFLYNPYQIGSYAQGYAQFSIPYAQLKGIIRPEYL